MGAGAQADHSDAADCLFLIGSYDRPEVLAHTPKLADSNLERGVHVVRCCSRSGKLSPVSTNSIGPNVAFVIRHPTNKSIYYASTERIDDEGEVITLELTPDGKLRELSRVRVGGRSTCYINFNRDRSFMMAVNYWDAKVSVMPIGPEGRPASPTSVLMQPEAQYVEDKCPSREEHWAYRQRWPHSHCCVTEPYTRTLHFVVDLGLDKIFAYRVNPRDGSLVQKAAVQLPKGKGPRHLVFHPRQRVAYLVNELDSTVSTFRCNLREEWLAGDDYKPELKEHMCEQAGAPLELMQCLSTLPQELEGQGKITPSGIWKAFSHCSEIRVHPEGHLLFIGNRGHDSIATYTINEETGELNLATITPSGGEFPRNFNIDLKGSFLVVGNQNSNNLTSFKIYPDGKLTEVDKIAVSNPNYVYPTSTPHYLLN